MKKLLFNYSNTVEYDKILATEVYPAIAKAFGVLAEDKEGQIQARPGGCAFLYRYGYTRE